MADVIRIGIYRPQEVNEKPRLALTRHYMRRDALHDAFGDERVKVVDWGNTDDTRPHEYVEVALIVLTPVVTKAAVAGLKYLGEKLVEKAIDESTSELVKWVISKLRKPQEEQKIRDFHISLPDGTSVAVNPPQGGGEIRIVFADGKVESISYQIK